MKLRYERLVQRFKRLPLPPRIGILVLACLLLFMAGTRVGAALYLMTH
jgi:hypothetical protein